MLFLGRKNGRLRNVLALSARRAATSPACRRELSSEQAPAVVRPGFDVYGSLSTFRIEKICSMVRKKIAPAGGHAKDIATSWARERPDLDPLDYLLSIYLLRIGRIIDRVGSRQWERAFGLSGGEIRVLLALRRAGGDYAMRPTDLFRALLVTSGAITKKVDRMSKAGLVRRINKGGLRVQLTTKGKQVADKTMTEISRASLLSKTRVSLSSQERKVLAQLCEKLLLDFETDAGVLELIE
jgi:DNA-binding MarR family transcriptional regulator